MIKELGNMIKQYDYIAGTVYNSYMDYIDIHLENDTCPVIVPYYLRGRRVFTCLSGEKYNLTFEDTRAIDKLIEGNY